MKRLLAVAVLITLLQPLLSCRKERKSLPAVPGNPAPAFSLKNLEGNTVQLSDFRGKVVVLDFWATWCEPCKESMRDLEVLHRKYGDSVVFLGISMDQGGSAVRNVKQFATEQRVTYRMLMDDGKASADYAVTRIPATFVLSKDHLIVRHYPGYQKGLGERIEGDIANMP